MFRHHLEFIVKTTLFRKNKKVDMSESRNRVVPAASTGVEAHGPAARGTEGAPPGLVVLGYRQGVRRFLERPTAFRHLLLGTLASQSRAAGRGNRGVIKVSEEPTERRGQPGRASVREDLGSGPDLAYGEPRVRSTARTE